MRHPAVILLGVLGILAIACVATVSLLGIWGFGPRVSYARVIVSRTGLVEGHYFVETSQGNFEVDRLSRVNFTNPEALFAEIKPELAYDITVVGSRRVILGFTFSPYIIAASASVSNLPPNFHQTLLDQGYESIPSSQLWVNWTARSLISIDPMTYVVLVGPAPAGVDVPVPSLTATRTEDLK